MSNIDNTKTAMILSAGYGTRLYPITNYIPKPLLPIYNQPILSRIIQNLITAGIENICINIHHLHSKIEKFFENNYFDCNIQLLYEPEILGTGGGVANARHFLENDDFFILHNGDIVTDFDLNRLCEFHLENNSAISLLLYDYGPKNMVAVSDNNIVVDINNFFSGTNSSSHRLLTYTGIAVISKEIFDYLPDSGYYDIVNAFLEMIGKNHQSIKGLIPQDIYWNDIGTVEKYLEVHRSNSEPNQRIFLSGQSTVSKKATLEGFVTVGKNAVIGDNVFLKDCVVLEDTILDKNESYTDSVVHNKFVVNKQEKKVVLSQIVQNFLTYKAKARLLEEHGSDRKFWRVWENDHSYILMKSSEKKAELLNYIKIGRFLYENGLGAPQIIDSDVKRKEILLEDLGEESLYRVALSGEKDMIAIYKKVIDLLVEIQSKGTRLIYELPSVYRKRFDYEVLRWETNYFCNRFLKDYLQIDISSNKREKLDSEFKQLALAVQKQPYCLMHRDFQSQNIFIKNGRIRIVDFQNAQIGPMFYDLMALLNDAYVDLHNEKEILFNYYWNRTKAAFKGKLDKMDYQYYAVITGLQRNMQALGAFAFLSQRKNKTIFEKYIPLGVKHLKKGLEELHNFSNRMERMNTLEKIIYSINFSGED